MLIEETFYFRRCLLNWCSNIQEYEVEENKKKIIVVFLNKIFMSEFRRTIVRERNKFCFDWRVFFIIISKERKLSKIWQRFISIRINEERKNIQILSRKVYTSSWGLELCKNATCLWNVCIRIFLGRNYETVSFRISGYSILMIWAREGFERFAKATALPIY